MTLTPNDFYNRSCEISGHILGSYKDTKRCIFCGKFENQQGDEVNVEEEKELAINRMVKLFIKAKHAEYDWVVECMNLNLFFGYEKEDIQKFIKERHKDVQGM